MLFVDNCRDRRLRIFLKIPSEKFTTQCSNEWGGGVKGFLNNVKKTALFLHGGFPKPGVFSLLLALSCAAVLNNAELFSDGQEIGKLNLEPGTTRRSTFCPKFHFLWRSDFDLHRKVVIWSLLFEI